MANLVPAPDTLGFHSPALGPWFHPATVTLPAPAEGELALDLTLPAGSQWLPPARGILSFFISTAPRPTGLATFRAPNGSAAFHDGRLIAVFRLLPEVEERLDFLCQRLPTLAGTGAAADGPRRPRIRSFVLEFEQAAPTWSFLHDRLYQGYAAATPVGTEEAAQAAHLGLTVSGGSLGNGTKPAQDLIRPGATASSLSHLMRFQSSTNARFWVFGSDGRPIEPGAAASWWKYLTTDGAGTGDGFTNLWAPGIESANQRTAIPSSGAEDLRTIHLTNAHGGPLEESGLNRITVSNASGASTAPVRRQTGNRLELSFSVEQERERRFPEARFAVLPDGRQTSTANLWPSGPVHAALRRDFARVAVRSLELDLVGQSRIAPASATAPARRRAADQMRTSTGLRVAHVLRGALRPSLESASAAAIATTQTSGPTRIATSSLSRDYGPRQSTLPAGTVPTTDHAPAVGVQALVGGGAGSAGSVVTDQKVFVTLTFQEGHRPPEGSWVRVWTQGFDRAKAEHIRLDGGAGRVDGAGRARLVATLPEGAVSPDALMGLEAMVATSDNSRLFSDLRFERPSPVGGSAADLAALAPGQAILICDTAAVINTPLENTVPSGAILVANPEGSPILVEPATIPQGAFLPNVLCRTLGAGDVLRLTEPAFRGQPEGEEVARWGATGATVTRDARSDDPWDAGNPLPGMERLESVLCTEGSAQLVATVGPSPLLSRYHELGLHQLGHPECPATEDAHGTGVFLEGPGALGAAEYARDRTAGETAALAAIANTPLAAPSTPTGNNLWAVGLRTEAAGVAFELEMEALSAAVTSNSEYDFDTSFSDKRSWINERIDPDIPSNIGTGTSQASVERALDRRILCSRYGAREAATSLRSAFARAERFVYIETPALDALPLGASEDQLNLFDVLRARLSERPGLQVLICLPQKLGRKISRHVDAVRDAVASRATTTLAGGERVAVFSPAAGPQRSLVLHSTSVVVDDVYALTGTTHLWRRGLSFDSSFAVALTDDQMEYGSAKEVLEFRRHLVAARLGLELEELPRDPEELVSLVRLLSSIGGHGRLAADRLRPPPPRPELVALVTPPTEGESWLGPAEILDRDGSMKAGLNPVEWLTSLVSETLAGEFNPDD